MLDASYAYPSFFFFFGLVWLLLYFFRTDLREEMLRLSILCAPLGVLGEYFARQDYYYLTIHFPAFWIAQAALIGFVYGGVAAALYAGWRHIHFTRFHSRTPKHPLWLPTLAVGGSLFMFTGMQYLQLNSVYLSIAVMLVGASSIILLRPDLLTYALGSGVAVGLLSFVFFLLFQSVFNNPIGTYWNPGALQWGYILGVPLVELFWAFAWGFLVGPAYEFEYTTRPRRTRS